MPAVRERYVTTNGIRLFCVEEGRGPLVLLVHGFPEFWWSWRAQLTGLAAAGYRAVAVDLPGYGRSDKPDVPYDEPWVNACLAGAVESLGAEQCVIAGHDWGGLLVWPFVRRYPHLVAGVVGVNTPDLPRGTLPPLAVMEHVFGDKPNYIMQFQPYGPAEYLIGRDPRAFMEAMLLGPATRRPEVFTPDVVDRFTEVFATEGSLTPPLSYYRSMDVNWHAAAWEPDAAAVARRFTVRFVDEQGRTMSHWNKLLKGALVRFLAESGADDPAALAPFRHPTGYRFDPGASDLGGVHAQVVFRVQP